MSTWPLRVAAAILLFQAVHLAWQLTHGGVERHHLLNRADLPALSNAWGIIFLPALGWLLSHRALRQAVSTPAIRRIAVDGALAMLAGVALSMAFAWGPPSAPAGVLLAVLASGLVLPVYRAQYVLGFMLGLSWTFGPMLPAIIAGVIATLSWMLHAVAYPAFAWAAGRLSRRP